ncbi:MAG: hypothetical protein ACTHJ8_20510 [Mucilaginibacter sp.]
MTLIYEDGFDFINTTEAFYKDFFIKDGNMLIPYINLCLMQGHPINKGENVFNLNYGLIVLRNIVLIKKNKKWIYDDSSFKYKKYQFLDIGGINVNVGDYEELKILFESGYLQVLDNAKFSEEFWIPIETPNYVINMDVHEINDFFSLKSVPENLRNQFV